MRLLLIAAAMLPLAACHTNSSGDNGRSQGQAGSRSFAVANFDSIDLRGPDDVDVKVGPAFSVTAEGDAALLQKLDITVVNGNLRIARQKNSSWTGRNDKDLRIHVVAPRLSDATITGAATLTIERLEGDVDLSIKGAGDVTVAAVHASDAEVSITGAGNIKLAAGSTQRLKATIRGAGDIDAASLAATRAEVSISGTGSIRGRVNGDAAVEVSGPADVELTGGARCTIRKSGPGDVRCS